MDTSLIKKVRMFVKQDRIKTTKDFGKDFLKHNFKKKEIKEAMIKGVHFKKEDLYPNPERYVSKFYVMHKFLLKDILIGYNIRKNYVILIHTSPLGNWELNQYKRKKKSLKRRLIKLFL